MKDFAAHGSRFSPYRVEPFLKEWVSIPFKINMHYFFFQVFIRFLVFCIVCGCCLALKSWELPVEKPWEYVNRDLDFQWLTFKKSYNKTYEPEEEIPRYAKWYSKL